MRLKLVVLRCADVERARRFYAALGLALRRERHGDGPAHYAATLGDVVLELYPRGERETTGLRIALDVDDVGTAVRRAVRAGGTLVASNDGVATLADPDGHRVVVSELRPTSPEARPMAPARVRTMLARAMRAGDLVTIGRARIAGRNRGYVAALGRWLVALAVVSDAILLDGYRVLRLRDISGVEVTDKRRSFAARALAQRRLVPAKWPRALPLSSLGALIGAAHSKFPLVTLHQELDDPDVCWIGHVEAVSRGRVRLHEISPDASWDDERQEHELARITRVDLGVSYEAALAAVAGISVK